MSRQPQVLVVANRTVDSAELLDALRERAGQEPIGITLLVPATWEVGDPHGGRQSALRRSSVARTALRDAGITDVEVVIGDSDPYAAVCDLYSAGRFDEVIVATLPSTLSKWLHIDLPRRVERLVGGNVRHVVAHERAAAPA
jgi:hypothetical protein